MIDYNSMKVIVLTSTGPIEADGISCGNGDTIEIRNYYKNGNSRFVSNKGKKWFRKDQYPLSCNFCESTCVSGVCDICKKNKLCVLDLVDPYDVEINENPDPNSYLYCESCYGNRRDDI